ncbi:mechanosensitive ion channel domain-containing protein [Buchnera aphidicola]|uniref:mechanosensitive ion channel domain-containing protein n=1 Tax=Buchnera aphidicola TaxID=9 RepID=UPI002092645C|nr:mechanosensitive ion channel domain-containing protein [Buchnera aphidicola]USS94031.1 mechanosensitive ion channel [Buchnera aphidicola (Sipha maydis)]WII23575.1 mechanosensitive ion channel [Buchnera aphidicola (Sipha maydis)]
MFKYSLITITIIILLSHLSDLQPTFVLALLGTLGMAIGLTLQSTISNFTAGILIKIFRQLEKGEYIGIGKISGTILNVDIFYTILSTIDGKIVVIPNIKIISKSIINYTRSPIRRNEFFISLSHNINIDEVKTILRKILYEEDRVLKNKDITIELNEFSDYSLKFVIRCWSKTKDLQMVYWDLMHKFKKKLDEKKIAMPFAKHSFALENKKNISS